MNEEQQPHAIWGLNFLQDMKGEAAEITGTYDSEQQLWTMLEQVQGGGVPEGFSGGISSQLDHLPVRNQRNMAKSSEYKGKSNTANGRDSDSNYDYD